MNNLLKTKIMKFFNCSSVTLILLIFVIIFISNENARAQNWTTTGDTISSNGVVKATDLTVIGNQVLMPGLVMDTNTRIMGIDKHGHVSALSISAIIGIIAPPFPPLFSGPCSSSGYNSGMWSYTPATNAVAVAASIPCTWVGIGINTPDAPLTISNSTSTNQFTVTTPIVGGGLNDVFSIDNVGNTNISGNTSITKNTTVGGGLSVGNQLTVATLNAAGLASVFSNGNSAIFFTAKTQAGDYNALAQANDNGIFWADNYGTDNASSGLVIGPWTHASGGAGIRIDASGNVGIGTWAPGYTLDVNGIIRANEVKVCAFGTCDFVFDKDYKLMPLNDLENYLNLNHHLPGIPSAQEMEKDGNVSLGKMDSQLLQKVEELTLYILQQQKEIDEAR